MMLPTRFELEGSPPGRRIYIYIYIQVRYSVFYMHQYKLSCRYNAAYIGACKTRYIVHVYITVLLKMDPRV